MNLKSACENLDIICDSNELPIEILKKQYRLKALLYHPDKNPSPEATSKFHEIQESYEYLLKYQGFMEPDVETEEQNVDADEPARGTYRWILFSFLKNILQTESRHQLFYTIIKKRNQS